MFTGMVIYLARIFGFYSWIKLSHFITLTTTRKKYCSAENTVHYYGDFQKVLSSDVFSDPPGTCTKQVTVITVDQDSSL